MQMMVPQVHASDALLDYVQAIVRYTRESPQFEVGPVAARLDRAAARRAGVGADPFGHPGVLPEDVQAVLGAVDRPSPEAARRRARRPHEIGELVLRAVAVP